jgi:hypothetical protein
MNDLPTRVAVLEKDMGQVKSDLGQVKTSLAKLFIWFTVVVAVGSPLFGGLLGVIAWNAARSVNQLDGLSVGVGDIKTDMAVVKSKQETQDKSWKLITQLSKRGAGDVSKTLVDE